MRVGAYQDSDGRRWDAFVRRFDDATFYHQHAWYRVMQATFGHRPHLLCAEDGDEVQGILPVVEVRAPGLGRKLIATPYQASVGLPLAEDPAVAEALIRHAVELARANKCGYVEVRGASGYAPLLAAGFKERHGGTQDSTIPIQQVDRSTIVRGHRQDINRVERLGIEIKEARTLWEWRAFYEMFEEAQRGFAAIGLGWAFFRNLFLDLPHHAKVRLARLDGELIGGSFLLCYHRTIISKQAVVKPEHARTGLGKGLVWSTLNWGKDAGYDFLNLGISLESQAAVKSFKEGFGAVSRSLSSYVLPLGTEPPSYEDLYEGYGLAKQVWRKMPLPATKLAGAVLTRWFC
ncbi:MAG: GNAT family N-acetyltransferase [Myxococcales bacterium]|nr:GNAT family N-acetyltransferase [Myxococcales bacterium]